MTAEKHLAAILAAWNETDGYGISVEMNEALTLAEKDFDGVEDDGLPVEPQGRIWPGARPQALLKIMINGEWREIANAERLMGSSYFLPGHDAVLTGEPVKIEFVD